MDHPSTVKSELRRGPLHTSVSVAAQEAGVNSSPAVKSELRPNPLYTSGSVAAQTARLDSSSEIKSGIRRAPLQSSGSVAAQASLGNDPSTLKGAFWRGPEHAPESVAEVGVRQAILEELALKILFTSGPLSLRELVAHIRLPFSVVNELLRRMRAEQFCEVTGMTGNIPQIAISSPGSPKTTVAMLQGLVLNQGDGWQWFLDELSLWLATVADRLYDERVATLI